MDDAHLILALKRLSSDLRELKTALRKKYPNASQQVASVETKETTAKLAESWLADLSQRPDVVRNVGANYLADLTVHFQRLLTFAERATMRRRYDAEIKAILRHYTADLVVPVMQGAGHALQANVVRPARAEPTGAREGANHENFRATAFVGHSFATEDKAVVESIMQALQAIGINVVTGEKPKADRISEKVKKLIEAQHLFVGVFTRRDKLVGKNAWSTSAWIIDEKAYAYGRNKKLVLLRETDVESIGGIQGDYEYIEFSRDQLQDAIIRLLQLFQLSVHGLRS